MLADNRLNWPSLFPGYLRGLKVTIVVLNPGLTMVKSLTEVSIWVVVLADNSISTVARLIRTEILI